MCPNDADGMANSVDPEVKRTVSESLSYLTTVGRGSDRVKCETKQFFVAGQAGWFFLGISRIHST